ncbi:Transposase and inactivated derivative [Cereibacter sphaeroides KD131]|nr:Transposase and inactivated derivative [Cereibacter sphaeroides KD131]
MLFAHLKGILRLDRLRWRGSNGAGTSSTSPPHPNPEEDGETDPNADGDRMAG